VLQISDWLATVQASETINVVAGPEKQKQGIHNAQCRIKAERIQQRNDFGDQVIGVMVLHHGQQ
jgi:hypothetical protein